MAVCLDYSITSCTWCLLVLNGSGTISKGLIDTCLSRLAKCGTVAYTMAKLSLPPKFPTRCCTQFLVCPEHVHLATTKLLTTLPYPHSILPQPDVGLVKRCTLRRRTMPSHN